MGPHVDHCLHPLPGLQQGAGCKAAKRDDRGRIIHTPQRGTTTGKRGRRDRMADQGYPVVFSLLDQHNPDIHDIGVGGPGFNQIVQSVKKRICVILL